jgi:3-dehydroquinate dehydratase-1
VLAIGTASLGGAPCVVLSIRDGANFERVAEMVAGGVSIIEVRIDEFSKMEEPYVVEELRKLSDYPVLGTIRMEEEGGGWRDTEEKRLALFRAILPHVDAVDIELGAREILDEVVADAHGQHKVVIGSYHNFEQTPPTPRLAGAVNDGKLLDVDIVKVATMCHSWEDLTRLGSFTLEHAAKNIVSIGMGPHGAASRVFFSVLGSLLTYTFDGEATAPGQLKCDDMLEYFNRLYPTFHEDSEEGE